MSEAESAEQHSGSAGLEFWLKSPYNYIVDQLVQAGHLAPDWAARVFTAEDAGSLFLSIMQAVINDNGRIEDMLQTERSKNTALQAHNQSLEAMCWECLDLVLFGSLALQRALLPPYSVASPFRLLALACAVVGLVGQFACMLVAFGWLGSVAWFGLLVAFGWLASVTLF
jgi:hypothetical protein